MALADRLELRAYQVPDSAGDHFAVVEDGDVERIRSRGSGALGPELLGLSEIRRIGSLAGDARYLLHDVTDATVDSAGRVLIASGTGAQITVFDSAGAFLRTIGRKGQGPGEFMRADRIWTTGDTVVVIDAQEQRATALLTGDGSVVGTWSRAASAEWARPVGRAARGWVVQVGRPTLVMQAGEVLPSSIVLRAFDGPFGDDGRTAEPGGSELVGRPLLQIDMPQQHRIGQGSNVSLGLFSVAPDFGLDGAGRVFVTSETEYLIEIHGRDGALARTISREYDPVPVSQGTIAGLRELVETVFTGDSILEPFHSFQQQRINTLAELPYPRTIPPLGRILVSADGSFWVERADAAPPGIRAFDTMRDRRPLPIRTRWDLFSAEGEFLGTAETPAAFEGMSVRGLEITGLERDEFMVEHVVTYGAGRAY